MSKKYKEVEKLDHKAREERLHELRIELIKKGVGVNKQNKGKNKEIKKAIARLLTVQNKQLDKKK